jgi:DNA-directed RNA polymerase specialized sigma24 family protein
MEMYKHHQEFIKFAIYCGENIYPEDLVQELYIHIHNKTVNKSFCLKWIYWRVMDLRALRKKHQRVDISEIQELSTSPSYDYIINNEPLQNTHWFHKRIFELYVEHEMTMREIAKETKISLGIVCGSISKCKAKVKQFYK